jgi:transglutaminase-like putative cysteine protease
VLVALWAVLAALRYLGDTPEAGAAGDRLWEITVGAQVRSVGAETVARVAVPVDTDHVRIIGQRLIYPGWRQRFGADSAWGIGRQARLSASGVDTQGFQLSYTVHQSAVPLMLRPALRRELAVGVRERYLRSSPLLGLEHEAVAGEVARLAGSSLSNEELLDRIFKRVHRLMPLTGAAGDTPRTAPEVLAGSRAGVLEKAYAMVALCRAARIPARLVTGLILREEPRASLHHWVEVFADDRGWLAFDPGYGYQGEVPHNFLPFVKDRADLVEVWDGGEIAVSYAVTNADEFLDAWSAPQAGWQSVFHLTRLSLEVRSVLSHLLLLPLAVLLTALFRELTGIRSYGTFMPALFALALVSVEWRLAVVTLAIVLLFGVLGRSAIPVKVRRPPRLTLVLSLVILGVAASLSLMDYLEWRHDGKVVVLPVVITAILVDLFYRSLDRDGPAHAIVMLGWTLLQVVLCLPVMQHDSLGHWLVAHPETHLLTLAAAIVLASYRGRRLAEHPRFRWLNGPSVDPGGTAAG